MAENFQDPSFTPEKLDRIRDLLFRDDFKIKDQNNVDVNEGGLNLLQITGGNDNKPLSPPPPERNEDKPVFREVGEIYDPVAKKGPTNNFHLALNDISRNDFGLLDKDLDAILSWNEIKEGSQNESLSREARTAVRRMAVTDRKDLRVQDMQGLIGPLGISDWHDLDPQFQHAYWTQIKTNAVWKSNEAAKRPLDGLLGKQADDSHRELVKRAGLIQPTNPRQQVEEILLCQEAIREFKGIERDASGRLRILDREATIEEHELAARTMTGLIARRHWPTLEKTYHALSTYRHGHLPEAEKLFREATIESDSIFKKQPGCEFSMAEIIQSSRKLLLDRKVRYSDSGFQTDYYQLDAALRAPLHSRVENAKYYLAPVVHDDKIFFDSSAPNYQPDKAQAILDDAFQTARRLYPKIDQLPPAVIDFSLVDRHKMYWYGKQMANADLISDRNGNGNADTIDYLKSFGRPSDRYIPFPTGSDYRKYAK